MMALTGATQLVGRCLAKQKVTGSIPGWGMCEEPSGAVQKAAN